MKLVRPECQYVLSNLAAGYTRSIFLYLIVGAGGQIAGFAKKSSISFNYY